MQEQNWTARLIEPVLNPNAFSCRKRGVARGAINDGSSHRRTARPHRSAAALLMALSIVFGSHLEVRSEAPSPLPKSAAVPTPDAAPTSTSLKQMTVWNLGEPETAKFKTVGRLRPTSGPQHPEFPHLPETNQALRFDGKGARVIVPRDGDEDRMQFELDDEITLQAWIAPRKSKSGSHRYVIGKGRTGSKGFRKDNQNWALRLTPAGDGYQLSFLFASADGPQAVAWHRWTTSEKVSADDGWHHVAVSYRFGAPDSIKGWIDGQSRDGKWDMAGATTAGPIVDQDEVWIGSSMSGSAGNSFIGSIDQVSVARSLADDGIIANAYRRDESIPRIVRVDKPVTPTMRSMAAGKVRFELLENLPAEGRWPDQEDLSELAPSSYPGASWEGDSFLFPRLLVRFDEWGIRSAWKAPVLLRIAADVNLPTGESQYLIRSRSSARLWIDGHLVGETEQQNSSAPSGEEPITPLAEPPAPGLRTKGYRQQETIVEYSLPGDGDSRTCRVVLELIAGGKKIRTETGEVCVAVRSEKSDSTQASGFQILIPSDGHFERLSLRENDASAALAHAESQFLATETGLRRRLAKNEDAFWRRRRELSDRWVRENPPPSIPKSNSNASHPVDAFLEHRIDTALTSLQTAPAKDASEQEENSIEDELHTRTFDLLQEHCLRCHGRATKGGLRLDSRAASLSGGDSGWAAVVPGKPDESELILRIQTDDPSTLMPLGGEPLTEDEVEVLSTWIREGANWPERPVDVKQLQATEPLGDAAFARRVSLDTIGLPPDEDEVRAFLDDDSSDKRVRLIDRLLDDERVADHLVSDWMDLLAENPSLLNTTLNSTGPFRFFLHDALVDRKPIDRMISELVLLRGDRHTGGSAGFGMAGENDSPLAAKAHVLASGLMGIELQCARCHDAPFHSTTQKDLFSIAAMLNRKPLSVPETSRVPQEFFEKQQRESLIEVTLRNDVPVKPTWSLARFTGVQDDSDLNAWLHNPDDTRDRLAALLTSPNNTRFAAVIVNRTWDRLMGAGLVASLSDWEHHQPSHPELLQWLAHRFVDDGYDIRKLMRLIMTSDVYARHARDPGGDATTQYFAAPLTRRLTAEQVVDSLLAATGQPLDCEELTFVHDGRRPLSNRLTLGIPSRAWMMATLNNERDRPSLSLPRARAVTDVLQAFGWTGSRQKPIHHRDSDANVLQPGVLANGTMTASLSKAAWGSPLADLAIASQSSEAVVNSLFLRFLSRPPSRSELQFFAKQLADGFDQRVVPLNDRTQPISPEPLPLVHWFNHLRPRSNEIQQEREQRVRDGPPPDPRLSPDWRERYEDVVWGLINHDEFVWIP